MAMYGNSQQLQKSETDKVYPLCLTGFYLDTAFINLTHSSTSNLLNISPDV